MAGVSYPEVLWDSESGVAFSKTREAFGGLSNMAAGYPIVIGSACFRTSEALYQACRFPERPDLQEKIQSQASPMAAKMVAKPHKNISRPDWDEVRVDIMRWCLKVKLSQNIVTFGTLLLSTGNAPIIELSRHDHFWGAFWSPKGLWGANVLGRLLMEVRDHLRLGEDLESFLNIEPLALSNFKLLGVEIGTVSAHEDMLALADDLKRKATAEEA